MTDSPTTPWLRARGSNPSHRAYETRKPTRASARSVLTGHRVRIRHSNRTSMSGCDIGLGGWVRSSDLLAPNQARYRLRYTQKFFGRGGVNRTRVSSVPSRVDGHCPTPRWRRRQELNLHSPLCRRVPRRSATTSRQPRMVSNHQPWASRAPALPLSYSAMADRAGFEPAGQLRPPA